MNIRPSGATRKYVLIVPDGAADHARVCGRSPLMLARTPHIDFIARDGVTGLVQTLYEDLPKESLVALLGILGWQPHRDYPCGRASSELLAVDGINLNDEDLAFRANFVHVENGHLVSYNANYITSKDAIHLVHRLNRSLQPEFGEFELYHNRDFRNTLVFRRAAIDPRLLCCPEPHESYGIEFDFHHLISGQDVKSTEVAARLNEYLRCAARLLVDTPANMLFPWSASRPLRLPRFLDITGFQGPVAIVGSMDFLQGIAKAGGIEFFRTGDGSPSTNYQAKGAKVVELLAAGHRFVLCHINAPDEASHMRDIELKIHTLEQIDLHVVRPIVEYFHRRPEELGGVMVVPDHYTNCWNEPIQKTRIEVHSSDPVPFLLWNGYERDGIRHFGEDEARRGCYGAVPLSHMDLLSLLGITSKDPQVS